MEKKEKKPNPCPYGKANWLSRVTFWWLGSLFRVGYRNQLKAEDLYDTLPEDQASTLQKKLERKWTEEMSRASDSYTPNLLKAVLKAFAAECAFPGIYLFLSDSLKIVQPMLIGQLILYFEPGSTMTIERVYLYAGLLGGSGLLTLLFNPLYFFSMHRVAMKMRAAVSGLIYRKVVNLSSQALHNTTSGQIVNLLSTDVEKFTFATETFHYIWLSPIEISVITYLMYREVGVSCFIGLAAIVPLIPLQFKLGSLFGKFRMKIGEWADKRIHMMNEVISGMRVIKMYCWEKPFSRLVSELRRNEVVFVGRGLLAKGVNISIYCCAPRLITLLVLVSHGQLLGRYLEFKTAFIIIGLAEVLKISCFLFLIFSIEVNSQLLASLKRIQA